MADDDLTALIRYQTALFTAITGVLVARNLSTCQEIAVAIDVLASKETDPTVHTLLRMAGAALKGAESVEPNLGREYRPFEVLAGGRP